MNIRQETEDDFAAIYTLIETAFKTAAVCDGDEQDYSVSLRAGDTYIPEFSLVAEKDGRIIGHIMLTKTTVRDGSHHHDFLLLAILSVAEDCRREGVGSALVSVALDRAKRAGHQAIFLAGDHTYYSRFGFVPASRFNIRHQQNLPAEMLNNIMAQELEPHALESISGTIDFQL